MRHTVGLLPASGKPWHAGHDGLLRLASKENDEVHLFVSTSDRIKKGEFPIYGSDMEKIWQEFLEPVLPNNVIVTYGGSPVSFIYKELEEAEAAQEDEIFFKIYSDADDILKFTDDKLNKSAPTLFMNGQIERRSVDRSETTNISGTEMRRCLQNNEQEKFISFLPASVRSSGKEIYNILKHIS
jgi:hypothetical protein